MNNRFLPLYNEYKKQLKTLNFIVNPNNTNSAYSLSLKNTKWYTNNIGTALLTKENFLYIEHSQSKRDAFYVSYLEQNGSFSTPPSYTTGLKKKQKYLVNFHGRTDKDVTVDLFFIAYEKGKKTSTQFLSLNSTEVIELDGDADDYRIAIRVVGKGSTVIQQIQLIQIDQVKGLIQPPSEKKEAEFNVEDYMWKDLLQMKNFTPKDWYVPKVNHLKNLSIKNGRVRVDFDLEEEQHQYISCYEQNISFGQKPTVFPIKIDSNNRYKVTFKGEKKDTAIAQLFVIFYSNTGSKEQVEIVNLNEERLIKVLPKAKFCRMAVRFSGTGFVEIHDVTCQSKKETGFLPIKHLRSLGYDVPNTLKDVKLGVICDEFTMQCLEPECDVITFSPDNWKATFATNKPHALFVESAWHGNNGKWTRKVSSNNKTNILDLLEVVNWCKENHIPTIFWNKEDPVHFNSFIQTAKHFDYIFTTDENSVENYKQNLHHDQVFALPFAAQPAIHNPIELYERENGISFAGSYYANKYIERQYDMNMLLESAAKYGLTIYDRNYGNELTEFYFPEHLRQYTKQSLKASEIHKAYKGYKVALNVNSVVDSPTMFSRRVFECLASNTPVVSTYSKGIENLFDDLVFMSSEKEDFELEFQRLLTDEKYYRERAHQGLREVLQYHTYESRLNYVLGKAGFELEDSHPAIGVWSQVESLAELQYVINMFSNQAYKSKELKVILKKPFSYKQVAKDLKANNIEVLKAYEKPEFKDIKYVAYFKPSNFYGKNYLLDLYYATKYSNSDVIGKRTHYQTAQLAVVNDRSEHSYTDCLDLDAAIISLKAWMHIGKEEISTESNLKFLFKKGYRLFAADRFNFVKDLSYLDYENVHSNIDTSVNI
ncbi:CgeB family protein [Priestia flexa]|uniref:CgeB family protein n=1 Tax=Priestia flexa TaxID=86664 RepID=UPI00077C5647|nr:glycosyltransferase [Priestia flexa]MED4590140.1 glycosyltransferase [Priestia flexa]